MKPRKSKHSKMFKTMFAAMSLSVVTWNAALPDQSIQDLVANSAYTGKLSQGMTSLEATLKTKPSNGTALFGLGTLQFLHAIEGLQQDLYRYGAGNQTGNERPAVMLPVLRVPVPPNPKAEVASYEKVRKIFEQFVERLEKADHTLSKVGNLPFKLPLDLPQIRLDSNGDGVAVENEKILSFLNGMGRRRQRNAFPSKKITFDTADAHWLRGYTNVLMSVGNFFLSVDFQTSYDVGFQGIFGDDATKFGQQLKKTYGDPDEIAALKKEYDTLEEELTQARLSSEDRQHMRGLRSKKWKIQRDRTLSETDKKAKLDEIERELSPLKKLDDRYRSLNRKKRTLKTRLQVLKGGSGSSGFLNSNFMDAISFIHTINWPVVEPDRFKMVRQNLLKVMTLNQTTWRLVQAETDDDQEWLPNPNQTSPFPSLKVTQEMIDSWLKITSSAEDVLEGRLLVPHIRFGRGVNMKRFFEDSTRFDLMLFLTGPGAIPFIERGPIWDQSLFNSLSAPMGRNFGAYTFWFN